MLDNIFFWIGIAGFFAAAVGYYLAWKLDREKKHKASH